MLQPGTGADSFEREVFGLFKEFAKKELIDELAGGPKNKLEIDQQVDMSFRFSKGSHDYFFIWECKNPEDPDNFSLKPAVEQLKIRYGLIEEKYKPKYCPSAVIRPVLAVNITLDQFKNTPDSVLQLMNPQPPYFTKDHVDYYSQLLTAYGAEYTFPTLMLEVFNIRIEYDGHLSFPALRAERFGKTLYTFQAKASDLLRIAYVHRATSANIPAQAYQRMLDPERLKDIAAKLRERSFETNFPNNIIASIDHADCSFMPFENQTDSGTLELKNRYGSLRVVDGQHRLYSFLYTKDLKDYFVLPVSAFLDLTQEEQSVIFASINYYAKRVTPDLIDYLFSLETQRSKVGKAALICIKLSDEDHVFGDDRLFLGYGSRKGRYLGLHSIVRALTGERYDLIKDGKGGRIQVDKDDEETPRKVLREYFKSIRDNFYNDWSNRKDGFVKTSNGIAVFLGLLSQMARGEPLDKLTQNTFNKYLRRLKGTRWANYREQELTSEGVRWEAIKKLGKRMKLI